MTAGKVKQNLVAITEHAAAVARLVARGKAAFDADEMLRFAGEDLIIRLGECVQRIDRAEPGFVAAHLELDLRKLKDSRNVLARGYDIVDYDIVWSILANHIPAVAAAVQGFLRLR